MDSDFTYRTLIWISLLVISIISAYFYDRRRWKKLRDLADEQGGNFVRRIYIPMAQPHIRLDNDGAKVRIMMKPTSKHKSATLSVVQFSDVGFKLRVVFKTRSRLQIPKLDGLQPVATGYSEFDEKYSVRSSDTHKAGLFFQDRDKREAVRKILVMDFDGIRISSNKIKLKKHLVDEHDLSGGQITALLEALKQLRRS